MPSQKRPSPSKSATLYKNGTKRLGNDGNKWIVTESKNGVKKWKLYKKPLLSKSKENFDSFTIKQKNYKKWFENLSEKNKEILYKLINIKPKINQLGIAIELIGLVPELSGTYMIDSIYELVSLINPKVNWESSSLLPIIYLDENKHYNINLGYISINHTLNSEQTKNIVILMKKTFGARFSWRGSQRKVMMIKLNKK